MRRSCFFNIFDLDMNDARSVLVKSVVISGPAFYPGSPQNK